MSREGRFRNVFETSSANKENLKRRLARMDSEKGSIEKKVSELQKKESDARERIASILAEIEVKKNEIETIQKTLAKQKEVLSARIKACQTLESKRNEIKTRFGTLKRMNDNYEWYKEGVRNIMKVFDPASRENRPIPPEAVFGLVADILEPKPEYGNAVEAALGESLQHILVKDQESGRRLLEYLREKEAGRGGFIPVDSLPAPELQIESESGPMERLLDQIEVKDGFHEVAQALLGDVILAETLQDAVTLYNRLTIKRTVVTREGDLISSRGIINGGSTEKLSGILSKKIELKNLGSRMTDLEKQLSEFRDEQKKMESELRDLEIRLQQHFEKRNILSRNHSEAEKNLYILSEDLKH
ncbi:MAG: hypothetical protein AB1659_13945, partial [Thermodesulfobacteriota bacterium]